MITRMQIALREGQGTRRSTADPSYSSGTRLEKGDPRVVHLAWCLIEAEPDTFEGETFHDLLQSTGRRDAMQLDVGLDAAALDEDERRPEPDADVISVCTRMSAVPPSDPFAAGLLGFGRLLVRKTRFPVAEGMEAFVAAGLLVGFEGTPTRQLLTLENYGRRLVETDRTDVSHAFPMGHAASDPFKEPIWGFDRTRRAFQSTMRLDVIDACSRYERLEGAVVRPPHEEAEFQELGDHWAVRSVLSTNRTDKQFARFRAMAREFDPGNEIRIGMDEYPNADRLRVQRDFVGGIVREIYANEDISSLLRP